MDYSKIASALIKELRVLSSQKDYGHRYFSIHRSLRNLKNRGLLDFSKVDISSLSYEEMTYILSDLNSPDKIAEFKSFGSPMRFWYLQHSDDYLRWNEKAYDYSTGEMRVLNPECYISSFKSNPDESFINEEKKLVALDHPLGYKKLARVFYSYDTAKGLEYIQKAIDRQISEFGDLEIFNDKHPMLKSIVSLLLREKSLKDELCEAKKRIDELETQNNLLIHHPPQNVE